MKWLLHIAIVVSCLFGTAHAQDQLSFDLSLKDCVLKMRSTNIELAKERIYRQCLNAASDSISGKQVNEWVGMVTYVYANDVHATLVITSLDGAIVFTSQALAHYQPQFYKFLSDRLIALNLAQGATVTFSGKVTLNKCDQHCNMPKPTPDRFGATIQINRLD